MNKSLTPRQIYDILMAIVGTVNPVADSAIDHDRLENLHMLEDVADIINDTLSVQHQVILRMDQCVQREMKLLTG